MKEFVSQETNIEENKVKAFNIFKQKTQEHIASLQRQISEYDALSRKADASKNPNDFTEEEKILLENDFYKKYGAILKKELEGYEFREKIGFDLDFEMSTVKS